MPPITNKVVIATLQNSAAPLHCGYLDTLHGTIPPAPSPRNSRTNRLNTLRPSLAAAAPLRLLLALDASPLPLLLTSYSSLSQSIASEPEAE